MRLQVKHNGQGTYSFEGQMTMETVPTAWPKLDTLWQGELAPKALELSAIDKIDTAGLAWILDILKQAKINNSQLKLIKVPESLIKLAKISDLEGVLPLE